MVVPDGLSNTIKSWPVHAEGALYCDVSGAAAILRQAFVCGLYAAPSSSAPVESAPPQTIISFPVHAVIG